MQKITSQLICKIILEKLKSMNPIFPPIEIKDKALMLAAKSKLLKENK